MEKKEQAGDDESAIDEMWDSVESATDRTIELPDAPTEDGTERDGVLSYAGEWHALMLGVGAGLTGSSLIIGVFLAYVLGKCRLVQMVYSRAKGCPLNENNHMRDAAKEPGYSAAGVVFGLFLNGWFIGQTILMGGVL